MLDVNAKTNFNEPPFFLNLVYLPRSPQVGSIYRWELKS